MAAVRSLILQLQGTPIIWLLLILHMPSSSSLQAKRSNGGCIESERDALLSFKAGLSDPGGQLSSWQGEDCCLWKGVHCSNRTNHVVKLDLHREICHPDHHYALGETISVVTKRQQLEFSQEIKYMVSIDLSCNDLTGEIPHGISSLDALKSLNFSWNHLSGRIPNNIGDLKALEFLDLSHNELSGNIPSGISALTSLTSFNLSYNDLSGRIPTGNQLQTLALDDPASMYVGNIGLCGPPLPKGCPGNGTSHSPADEPEKQDNGMVNSIYLSMIIGFIFGLWMVFCIMLLHKGMRYSYFFFIDDMYQKVCVHMIVTWNFLVRR
ncbi:unnamed protein product [Urochloa humidicola]